MKRHAHYFKPVAGLTHIDIYRVLLMYRVTDPCLQHAIKKLLVAGGRGVKDCSQDINEAIASLERWKEMRGEELLMRNAGSGTVGPDPITGLDPESDDSDAVYYTAVRARP